MKWAVVLVLCGLIVGVAVLRPVCMPLTTEQLAQFTEPIEQRDDRDIYLKVFQRRDERWHQCKTWISRQLFF